jgi:hypothetical protein
MASTVYIVHCIDTEGPLHESLEATFERLHDIFGLELEPDRDTLKKLQQGEVDLGGIESAVQKVVDPQLLGYNDTWDKIDAMLQDALSSSFRNELLDSYGGGWVYNWFCVDHVDYDINPRRRSMGYHAIFNHYASVLDKTSSGQDSLQFHFHPHPPNRKAHKSATHWWAESDALHQVLTRRIIDRNWFPSANRPGFHVTRPDSHWFLEQHIPFDYANQAVDLPDDDEAQSDLTGGRFGDWRRAPKSWTPYHPSHDDYQTQGNCRRWIARCLNVGTRYKLLEESHVRQAFEQAQKDQPVVLAFTNHDFRDIRPDVRYVRELLEVVSSDYPNVPFKYASAVDAMRESLNLPEQEPCGLDLDVYKTEDRAVIEITSEVPTFGPQPWLAFKTRAGSYHFDNCDIEQPFHKWRYVLDDHTFPLHTLSDIGVAANNAYGRTTVANLDVRSECIETTHWN